MKFPEGFYCRLLRGFTSEVLPLSSCAINLLLEIFLAFSAIVTFFLDVFITLKSWSL